MNLNSDPAYSDFSEMAHDEAYQKLARELTEEFAILDWEAFQLAEPSQLLANFMAILASLPQGRLRRQLRQPQTRARATAAPLS